MGKIKNIREWTLFVLVGGTALLANLPEDWLAALSVERNVLLALLALIVFIALFLYLKFQFFFLVVLLAVAANMPADVADKLGVATAPLVIAMIAMVGISLINYVVGILPTGLETKPKERSVEGIKAIFYAIEKGNLVYAQKLLSKNFDPNLRAENGYTPLMYATLRGDAKMVELLLRNGADVSLVSKSGDTAIELALSGGFPECANILKQARAEQQAREEALRARQAAAT
ncbi:MAG TPA: ankyrin repeat domain-containing protein [Burkholderiales bacterium]